MGNSDKSTNVGHPYFQKQHNKLFLAFSNRIITIHLKGNNKGECCQIELLVRFRDFVWEFFITVTKAEGLAKKEFFETTHISQYLRDPDMDLTLHTFILSKYNFLSKKK